MSADWALVCKECGCTKWKGNLTYNLNSMLEEAGWHWPMESHWPVGRAWSRDHLQGVTAADLGEKAAYVLQNLKADPAKFQKLNPPNGWGSYENLLEVWKGFVAAIREHPTATVDTSF